MNERTGRTLVIRHSGGVFGAEFGSWSWSWRTQGHDPNPGRPVFLVHGFRTRPDQAQENYSDFVRNLQSLGGWQRARELRVIWPSRRWDFVEAEENAVRAGAMLSEAVAEVKRAQADARQSAFVGHSLGCRMILEAGLASQDIGDWTLLLMAAAVPVLLVAPDQRLSPVPGSAARSVVLHSKFDGILDSFFRLGSKSSVSRSGMARNWAVGTNGEPKDTWSEEIDVSRYDYGHSDYWSGEFSAYVAAREIGLNPPHMVKDWKVPVGLAGRAYRFARRWPAPECWS